MSLAAPAVVPQYARYRGLPPLSFHGYTIGCQLISENVDDIRPLHAAHYAETETLYLDATVDVDYQRYAETEARGDFVLFTVREGSTMVGYLQYYIGRDMHSQGMYTASEDAFFLLPEHRGRHVAPKLLDYAEHFLQKLGCRYVGMSDKSPVGGVSLEAFLKRRNYRPVAVYYVKELKNGVLQEAPKAARPDPSR